MTDLRGKEQPRRAFVGALAGGCTLCAGIGSARAQVALNLDPRRTCNFSAPLGAGQIYTFSSGANPTAVLNRILGAVGIPDGRMIFTMRAANVGNAAAGIGSAQERLILYSEDFMQRLAARPDSDWVGLFILAHEVGHHILFHTFDQGGGTDRRALELEADHFAGRVVALLGGTLDQAQAAVRAVASEAGSNTHPPRSARFEAIAVGFGRYVPNPNSVTQPATRREVAPQAAAPAVPATQPATRREVAPQAAAPAVPATQPAARLCWTDSFTGVRICR